MAWLGGTAVLVCVTRLGPVTVLLSPGADFGLVERVNRILGTHGDLAGAADPWELRFVTGYGWCLPKVPPALYGGVFLGLRLPVLAGAVLPVPWRYPGEVQVMWHGGAGWVVYSLAGLRAASSPDGAGNG